MPVKPRKLYGSLYEWRTENNLSQRQAADLIPMAQASWSRLETSQSIPRPKLAQRISDVTGVPVSVLIQRYYAEPTATESVA